MSLAGQPDELCGGGQLAVSRFSNLQKHPPKNSFHPKGCIAVHSPASLAFVTNVDCSPASCRQALWAFQFVSMYSVIFLTFSLAAFWQKKLAQGSFRGSRRIYVDLSWGTVGGTEIRV
eukprot:EG_transcript_32622